MVTIHLTKKEAGAYLDDLRGTLNRFRTQEKDLQACIRHLRRQPGDEDSSPAENEIRIKGLEFDIGVTQKLIEKYERDIRDLEEARSHKN